MRIAYVLSRFPVLSETFVQNEVEELERRGEQIHVFSLERPAEGKIHPSARRWVERTVYPGRGPAFLLRALGAHLALALRSPARWLRGVRLGLEGRLWRLTLSVPVWATEIRRLRIEHMHVHFGFHGAAAAMLLARWTGVPFSVLLHADDIFRPQSFLPLIVREARFVATGTEYNREQILALHPEASPDRVRVLRYSVPAAPFEALVRRYRGPEQELRIISVGRLVQKKGHIDLVRALGMLKTEGVAFEARILGEGPERGALEQERRRWNLEDCLELPGAADETEVREALVWADAFVLPCTMGREGARDGLPVVLMEAMLSATPVVTTDFIGIPELCGEGNTLLVPPEDPESVADALRALARMSSREREELAERGYRAVRAMHDPERNMGLHLALWGADDQRSASA